MGLGRDMAYLIGAALSAPVWGASLLRTGKWRTDWAGRLGRTVECPTPDKATKTLLIHGVSVGEINLLRGLVHAFETQVPHVRLVIAATTNTGIERAEKLFGQRHHVVRYPLDLSFSVKRFLDAIKPDGVAMVELELWPNFIDACHERDIRVCIINGRLSERSFRGYRRFRPLVRSSFASLDAAAVQTETYAERFRDMGTAAQRVHVLDTMKWDGAALGERVEGSDALADDLGLDRSRPIIVAGSTGPGEERWLIEQWENQLPEDVQLVLAPRKPERFNEVAALRPGMRRRTQSQSQASRGERSADQGPGAESQLFLLDTIGELGQGYALADLAIVGRSFLGLYGSDVTEPIALGKPTLVGPYHSDFTDTVDALREARGLIVTDQPMEQARRLLADPVAAKALADRGREVIGHRQGATQRHLDLLMATLNDEPLPML